MANSYIANVPRLKGRENFDEWTFAVENFLVLEGLQKCIEGTEQDADKDAKAKAKLVLTLDTSLYVHVKGATTAKELWDKLKAMFSDSGFVRKISLLRTLISSRLENHDSMHSYVTHVIETGQRLRGTGFKIDDEWIGSLLLAGLPGQFSPMIMAIEHSGISITTDAIKSKLLDMEGEAKTGNAFVSQWQDKKAKIIKKDIKCYHCKKSGHYRNKCPDLKKGNESAASATHGAFNTVFLSGNFKANDFYVDSGASVHLTARKDWLENVRVANDLNEIVVANKQKIEVECVGDLNIKTSVNGQLISINVKNVHYVPELSTNLLSVSQIINQGNTVVFDEDCCKIFNQCDQLIGTANLVNRVYKLNIANDEKCCSLMAASSKTWHRRFGHLNQSDLNKMRKGAVVGFEQKGKGDSTKCTVCCEGKQQRQKFRHSSSQTRELLEIVHTDLCGPMEQNSIGGSRYFILFEDDFSRMSFVYFLKTKDQALDTFKEFKNMVENQTNRKIKILRSDGGGEFCGKIFEDFLKTSGIIHQKTTPYTPQQNGISERANRTIVERARCMLFDADLTKKFWAEAVHHSVNIRNRSIAAVLSNKTPYEMWTGKKPDVRNLKIFGSLCMVHVPKEKRKKWDKKSEKKIFIGYADNMKGFRVYDYESNQVTVSRDVIIIEKAEDYVDIPIKEEIPQEDIDSVEEFSNEEMNKYVEEEDQEEPLLRRSTRIPKPKRDDDFVYMCAETPLCDPTSMNEALSSADAERWRRAMEEEIGSFEENAAWELVEKPTEGTVVKCKWVFKKKKDVLQKVRYRARLVAKGFEQKAGVDYHEIYSRVVRYSTLRLLLDLSVQLNLNVSHLDVTTAFLNGDLEDNVYMSQPEGFEVKGQESKVLKLNKAIYGLKQSSRAWYKKVDEILTNIGYVKSELEPCLFMKFNDNSLTIIALYVDDFFVFSNDESESNFVKSELSSKFKVKDLGQMKHCLGINVNFNKENNIVTIDQKDYIEQLLVKFNMKDCKGINTPLESNIHLDKSDTCNTKFPYQQLIGSLMYLAVLTRPDIAFSVSYMSQFNTCFNETHWKQAKRILRYLNKTKDFCLKFEKSNEFKLECFVDSDWGGDSTDRKSYSGFVFKLSNGAISWESKKQSCVSLSSTEAEYVAISEAAKEAIYLKRLLFELTDFENMITIHNDNQSAQKLCINPVGHSRTKHIDIKHHFIRGAISEKLIDLKYLPSEEMIADILTKSLGFVKHMKFLAELGLSKM